MPHPQKSRGYVFMDWIKQFDLFKDVDNRVRILRIDPIFDNGELIANLKDRGLQIQARNQTAIAEGEQEILESNYKQYDARICGAFITVETQQ